MKRFLYWSGLFVCAGGLLLCSGLFLRQWMEYRAGEQAYQALTDSVVTQPSSLQPERSEYSEPVPDIDFEALERINLEVVGWLYLPDTAISYPVAQGENNTYYLKHLFDGTPNSAGSLFLDSRCHGFEGKNSVIYGHYMKNGTLFASLSEYQDQEYYEAHPNVYLITPEGVLTVQLFSAYIAGAEDDAWQLDFDTEEEYGIWLEGLQDRSCFVCGIAPTTSDRVVTLSTCNYTFENARFVCHGRILEP